MKMMILYVGNMNVTHSHNDIFPTGGNMPSVCLSVCQSVSQSVCDVFAYLLMGGGFRSGSVGN